MTASQFANSPAAMGSPCAPDAVPELLEREIRRIYSRSPIYGRRFPLHREALRWSCYREIPALSKREIVETGHQSFFEDYREIERGLADRRFEYENTSGTTSAPMTVIMEDGWWSAQTLRAYRASPILREFADRPHRKCVLAPVGCSSNLCPYEDHPFPNRYFDGTVYLNLSSDPFAFSEAEWDRIVVELQATQPEILEGEPVYLSLLARAAAGAACGSRASARSSSRTARRAFSTAAGSREAFPAPQVDLYGSTEAGYLFVGEAFRDDSRAIDENAFIELVPWRPEAPEIHQIHVTTRGREAMPLLRYHTGDIVMSTPGGFRILGRERDLYFRPDGSLVSASDVDAALPAGFSCWHYCLSQTGENRWDFHYVADKTADSQEVEAALSGLLGAGVRVNAFRRKSIAPAASGKFSLLKPLAKA